MKVGFGAWNEMSWRMFGKDTILGMSRSGAIVHEGDGYWAYSDTGLSAVWIGPPREKPSLSDADKNKYYIISK